MLGERRSGGFFQCPLANGIKVYLDVRRKEFESFFQAFWPNGIRVHFKCQEKGSREFNCSSKVLI